MRTGMMVLGVGCLAYYALLLSVKMDFSVIWLAAGLLFVCGGVWGRLLPGWAKGGICIVLAIGGVLFLAAEFLIIRQMGKQESENLDYLIVLGAQVRGEVPSRALSRRLEKARDFLRQNPKTQAVLSGGKGDGEQITEAEAMRRYLTDAGILEDRLILEEHSTSTLENLQFCARLLDTSRSVGILNNNFHVYRALKLAEKQGYAKAYGIAAPSDPLYQVHYLVREFFALVKEKIKGNI